jgi:hypothetical protein
MSGGTILDPVRRTRVLPDTVVVGRSLPVDPFRRR